MPMDRNRPRRPEVIRENRFENQTSRNRCNSRFVPVSLGTAYSQDACPIGRFWSLEVFPGN
jgi:hypothetical protein